MVFKTDKDIGKQDIQHDTGNVHGRQQDLQNEKSDLPHMQGSLDAEGGQKGASGMQSMRGQQSSEFNPRDADKARFGSQAQNLGSKSARHGDRQ